MFLCIIFNNETTPFILQNAPESECLRAIEKAKEWFRFERDSAIVRDDHIFLYAWSKQENSDNPKIARRKKRIYCYNDKILLQTDALYPGEVEPTRELLGYERGIESSKICVIEI